MFGFFSKRLFSVWLALLAILIGSAGDELFQVWLSARVGDLRDVGINIIAGSTGPGFAWVGLREGFTSKNSLAKDWLLQRCRSRKGKPKDKAVDIK